MSAIAFASTAVDQQVENVLRMTVAEDHLVVVSVNATKALFDRYEAALRATIETVVVR